MTSDKVCAIHGPRAERGCTAPSTASSALHTSLLLPSFVMARMLVFAGAFGVGSSIFRERRRRSVPIVCGSPPSDAQLPFGAQLPLCAFAPHTHRGASVSSHGRTAKKRREAKAPTHVAAAAGSPPG